MPGPIIEEQRKRNPEILFELTLEDNKNLRESSLLDLVNYGQEHRTIKIFGTNGKIYHVTMALLWDEDFIDILKKTTAYAADPVLRGRLLRRLKLFKAIQNINEIDYNDVDDVIGQRQLWTILSRMSDVQIDYLDGEYTRVELERNMQMSQDIQRLGEQLNDTAPEDAQLKKEGSESTTQTDHSAVLTEHAKNQEIIEQDVEAELAKHGMGPNVRTAPIASKPQKVESDKEPDTQDDK